PISLHVALPIFGNGSHAHVFKSLAEIGADAATGKSPKRQQQNQPPYARSPTLPQRHSVPLQPDPDRQLACWLTGPIPYLRGAARTNSNCVYSFAGLPR